MNQRTILIDNISNGSERMVVATDQCWRVGSNRQMLMMLAVTDKCWWCWKQWTNVDDIGGNGSKEEGQHVVVATESLTNVDDVGAHWWHGDDWWQQLVAAGCASSQWNQRLGGCALHYGRISVISCHLWKNFYFQRGKNQEIYWQWYKISDSKLTSLANMGVFDKLISLVLCDVKVI